MRLSRLFPRTLYQAPAEAERASHRLFLRAGLARPLGAGVWGFLPLGQQVRRRIQDLARGAMAALGGQEIGLPLLVPAEPWEKIPRRPDEGSAGLIVHDRAGRPHCLPDTVEPLLTTLVRPDLRSHRLLPLLLYGFRERFAEQVPAGQGPLSARQALILEAFSLQPDSDALTQAALELNRACVGVIERCGLSPFAAETSLRPEAHPACAFVDPRIPGCEPFVHCPGCGYAASLSAARRAKDPPPPEEPLPLEEVRTPGCRTIAELASYLGVAESRTAKAVFLVCEDRFILVVLRGDMEVNEAKLAFHLGARALRAAQDDEIAAVGISPGYGSAIGMRRSAPQAGIHQAVVVADDLIPECPNLVAGANRADGHLRNVNYGRDYRADLVADVVLVRPGDPCPCCRTALEVVESTVLGRVWVPGRRTSDALGATFQDAAGEERPLWLACAEVEVDRLVAASIELHHDEAGIRWPAALAPYTVYLMGVGEAPEVAQAAAALYAQLRSAGVAVLYDDRAESAGSKFADADLLGVPLRVVVGRRTLQQGAAEVKRRDQPREAAQQIPLGEVLAWLQRETAATEDRSG